MNNKIKKIINKKNKSKIVCLTAYSKNIAEEIDKYAVKLSINFIQSSLKSLEINSLYFFLIEYWIIKKNKQVITTTSPLSKS